MEFGGTTDWGTDTEGFQGFNAVFACLIILSCKASMVRVFHSPTLKQVSRTGGLSAQFMNSGHEQNGPSRG